MKKHERPFYNKQKGGIKPTNIVSTKRKRKKDKEEEEE